MTDAAHYRLQFFRQWLGDAWIDDMPASGSLEHVKTLAQVKLETLAREKTGRSRPRIVRVVDEETHAVLAEFRLTLDGPVEVLPPPIKPRASAPGGSRLKLVRNSGTSQQANSTECRTS